MVSFLKPLTRTKRDSTYSQLSPDTTTQVTPPALSTGPESTHKIWERLPYKKHHREEVHGRRPRLRKKVQFAKDEDLHDILDYWKGVSAQQSQTLSPPPTLVRLEGRARGTRGRAGAAGRGALGAEEWTHTHTRTHAPTHTPDHHLHCEQPPPDNNGQENKDMFSLKFTH